MAERAKERVNDKCAKQVPLQVGHRHPKAKRPGGDVPSVVSSEMHLRQRRTLKGTTTLFQPPARVSLEMNGVGCCFCVNGYVKDPLLILANCM